MRDRAVTRKKLLMNRLIRLKLMPLEREKRKILENENPYEIREKAIKIECTPFEIGRAIFHLAQRRGFKSNRKTAGKEDGVIHKSIREFKDTLQRENLQTVGEFLAKRQKGEDKNQQQVGQDG